MAFCACALLSRPLDGRAGEASPWRQLTAQEAAAAFVGQTIEGVYADGRWWSEDIASDGTTAYREDDLSAAGSYWFAGERMCFLYRDPLDGGACFELWQRSANCYDVYPADDDGTIRAALWQRVVGVLWHARFWRTGHPSTCPAQAMS